MSELRGAGAGAATGRPPADERAAQPTGGSGEKTMQGSDEWRTVGKERGRPRDNKKNYKKNKQSERKMSPRKQPENRHRGALRPERRDKTARAPGADTGDGSAVFAQLEHYLRTDATPAYVFDTVRRLDLLAKNRRFQDHIQRMGAGTTVSDDQAKLRDEWRDEASVETQEAYQGLRSYWNGDKEEHQLRLQHLMIKWVLELQLSQEEIETRLQFFTFEEESAGQGRVDETKEQQRSYIGAVGKGLSYAPVQGLTLEQQKLFDLCVKPMQELTKLRARTEDEDRALLMILNHELEVPHPPNFLVQSMTARELAYFTDVFLAIEYPIYAHLAAGQRFSDNLPKAVLLAQINVGAEAARAQKQDIADFKAAVSRVTLDTETRVLTATFKGKQTATRWINWKFPFAGKLLTMVDYEGQREAAEATHVLVNIDYYTFTVAVRKGTVTSSDMYWVLTTVMGLQVQSLKHTGTGSEGMDDTQWLVRTKGGACPTKLKSLGFMAVDDAEIVVHHHGTHVNWPCKTCYSPEHPTKYCRTALDSLDSKRMMHKKELKGKLPSNRGKGSRSYKAGAQPKTLDQLMMVLNGGQGRDDLKREERVSDSTTTAQHADSPARPVSIQPMDKLEIPKEWQQHSPTRLGAEGIKARMQGLAGAETTKESRGPNIEKSLNAVAPDEKRAERGSRDSEGDVRMEECKGAEEEGVKREGQPVQNTTPTPQVQQEETRGRQPRVATTPVKSVGSRRVLKPRPRKGGTPSPTRVAGSLTETKRDSVSPKRILPEEWGQDGEGRVPPDASEEPLKAEEEGTVRSLSPTKRRKEEHRKKNKAAQQSLMHQFLTAEAVKIENQSPEASQRPTQDTDEATKKLVDEETTEMQQEVSRPSPATATAVSDDEDCRIVKVNPPDDAGALVDTWMGILGARVTDVAANGHCAWIAFYAALHNQTEGLIKPTSDTAKSTNALKKQVINGLIANLADELALHPTELAVELAASEIKVVEGQLWAEQVSELAAHYATQRKRSVRAPATRRYWARTPHVKAMAMHAREPVFVLDVHQDGKARMQAYAYTDLQLKTGEAVESGTVRPVPTHQGLQLFQDLVEAGILPLVLILKWGLHGNHFQAITYDAERHKRYADRWTELADKRNEIWVKHGGTKLDAEPYDSAKTATAAASALKAIKKAVKASRTEAPGTTDTMYDSGEEGRDSQQDDQDEDVLEKGEGLDTQRQRFHPQNLDQGKPPPLQESTGQSLLAASVQSNEVSASDKIPVQNLAMVESPQEESSGKAEYDSDDTLMRDGDSECGAEIQGDTNDSEEMEGAALRTEDWQVDERDKSFQHTDAEL